MSVKLIARAHCWQSQIMGDEVDDSRAWPTFRGHVANRFIAFAPSRSPAVISSTTAAFGTRSDWVHGRLPRALRQGLHHPYSRDAPHRELRAGRRGTRSLCEPRRYD